MAKPKTKYCPECKQTKPLSEFYQLKSGKSSGYCKECQKAYSRRYRASRTSYTRKMSRIYRNTIEGHLASVARGFAYRAQKFEVESTVTAEQLYELLCHYQSHCAYCGRKVRLKGGSTQLEFDHMTPMSQGGANTIENVVPSCTRCNFEKGDRSVDEWTERWYETKR